MTDAVDAYLVLLLLALFPIKGTFYQQKTEVIDTAEGCLGKSRKEFYKRNLRMLDHQRNKYIKPDDTILNRNLSTIVQKRVDPSLI